LSAAATTTNAVHGHDHTNASHSRDDERRRNGGIRPAKRF